MRSEADEAREGVLSRAQPVVGAQSCVARTASRYKCERLETFPAASADVFRPIGCVCKVGEGQAEVPQLAPQSPPNRRPRTA